MSPFCRRKWLDLRFHLFSDAVNLRCQIRDSGFELENALINCCDVRRAETSSDKLNHLRTMSAALKQPLRYEPRRW